MAELDFEIVRHALREARRLGLAKVELEVGESEFSAVLEPLPAPAARPATKASEPAEPVAVDLRSPMVGYVRDGKVPLSVGSQVEKGQAVLVIEALGLANDVEATTGGEVVELLVAPGQAVEYGQILARIMP